MIIDFAVVPTAFRIVKDFFNAGDLGIALFSKLNHLEILVSTCLIVLTSFQMKRNKAAWPFFLLSLVLFSIAMFYFSYLTPKIIHLTELWKQADATGALGIAGVADIQQEHQFFHKLYIKIDAVKLLILTFLLGFGIYRENKWV